ncbi:hypothetical protein [Nocardiopsis lambiniae]|uniref:Uncharacterized protein n=1 Tax=Nocardiopsis lambiniae TaxID=3075539 RepID=A0ABU2M4H4_9ACTN|nr:hypothetical protein [Nocardiopsis sp. DSM 44743]MDT0327548.1 hypothetical protein [Nocardiopsis sp. DSM 44743]
MNASTTSATTDTITPLRRNLLRACHLLLVVGLGLTAWPRLLASGPDRPVIDGAFDAVLCALQLLAIAGLFAPVRMVAVLVFEVLWKAIWVLVVAVPLWSRDALTPEVTETLFACAFAVPFVVIIPWRALVGDLIRRREPWHGAPAETGVPGERWIPRRRRG